MWQQKLKGKVTKHEDNASITLIACVRGAVSSVEWMKNN